MIIIETIEGGLIRTYSDKGVYIHGGFPEGDYVEAIDPIQREYVETDLPIESTEEEIDQYAFAGRILMGVER